MLLVFKKIYYFPSQNFVIFYFYRNPPPSMLQNDFFLIKSCYHILSFFALDLLLVIAIPGFLFIFSFLERQSWVNDRILLRELLCPFFSLWYMPNLGLNKNDFVFLDTRSQSNYFLVCAETIWDVYCSLIITNKISFLSPNLSPFY